MANTGYAWEKLTMAVDALATVDEPLRQRLWSAWLSSHTLDEDDVPEGGRPAFRRMREILTSGQGSVEDHVETLEDAEAQEAAEAFLAAYHAVLEVFVLEHQRVDSSQAELFFFQESYGT